MLHLSIVDDVALDAEQLQGLVVQSLKEKNISHRIRLYQDPVDFIRSQEPCDLAFLDIRMDKINGIETAHFVRRFREDLLLVFVTNMAQMAIRGYEVDALDFLIKPTDVSSVSRVLDKALKLIERRGGQRLYIELKDGILSISSEELYYVEVFDHELVYHCVGGTHVLRGKLKDLESKLDPKHFMLCSRSCLVNLRHITELSKDQVICAGQALPISRSRYKALKDAFVQYHGERL